MIIYKIQNKINGKIYIGQTIGTLLYRINKGWGIKRAFEEPLNENKRR